MKSNIATSLLLWTAIGSAGLSSANAAEELDVVRDGVLIKEALKWPDEENLKHPFWNDWINCAGETVDGLFVVPKTVGGKKNHARFVAAKSALGDCEFKLVFSYTHSDGPNKFPNVCIGSRGCLRFSGDGKQVWMSLRKVPLPVQGFSAPCPASVYDGKLHSVVVKRVGDMLSFYCDDKKLNEQPIDPDANLHIWFDSLTAATKIKSIRLTAEKLSDKLEPAYKSAATVEEIFVGSKGPSREYGKAAAYRIPALAVSTKGTILAFAEARRLDGGDIGDIDAVLRRSEDNGKTWGPEIVVWDDEGKTWPWKLEYYQGGSGYSDVTALPDGRVAGWPCSSRRTASTSLASRSSPPRRQHHRPKRRKTTNEP